MREPTSAAVRPARRPRSVLLAAWLAIEASAALAQAFAPVPPPPSETGAPPRGTLENLAARAGVQTCLPAARRFGPALTGPAGSHAALLMAHPVAPDASAFGVVMERNETNGVRFVSATFAPTLRGGCDVSYDMVDVWRKSCQDVALEELRHEHATNVVGQRVAVIPYSATHHVYLIRIAGGCLSVTREVLYP